MVPVTQRYLADLQKSLSRGDATEHTHRPAFKAFIESLIDGVGATNEPARAIEGGAPDFTIWRGQTRVGIAETKDVGEDLAKVEKTEQLKRYRAAFPNLLLTDYLGFRWYVSGELRMTATLGQVDKRGITPEPGGDAAVAALLAAFCKEETEFPASAGELASRMARSAQLIRDSIERSLKRKDANALRAQMEAFREVLLHDLTAPQFADMYAQTICYGLFAARCGMTIDRQDRAAFSRAVAADMLPRTNPFLRKVFAEIAGADLDEGVRWAVDDVAEMLRGANIARVLEDFGRRTRQEDPVVHFYETFLAAYDPKMREARGVYYTPEPVVSYIVRSVDHILRTDFGLADGLADSGKVTVKDKDGTETESHRVLILDPATGTGTFLHGVVDEIHARVTAGGNKGVWSAYVREHLLPRLFGFELLMAPYAVAHMKLGIQLGELGYDFGANERLGVYLTNTLEEARDATLRLPFADVIANEARQASGIKRERPIMVVLGNPPYSGHSENKGEWISGLLRGKDTLTGKATGSYFECDGKPLGERNPKWLNDDYVKFIRFAQWRIEQTGNGILAFISNNGYIDNPTFRGMRQSLMRTFDDIYILDLHGNSKKKERAPDGGPDENVFDIMQGVCVGIFVKRPATGSVRTKGGGIRHAHLWGPREIEGRRLDTKERVVMGGKYPWLNAHAVNDTKWKRVKPDAPYYLFVPQDVEKRAEYERGWKITDAMPVNVLGFQTHRDEFAVAFDEKTIHERVAALRDPRRSDVELRAAFGLSDNRDWQLKAARAAAAADAKWKDKAIQCAYRPFDTRWCYFNNVAMDYPRTELVQHVAAKENLCLNTVRQTKMPSWQHAVASARPAPAVFVELKDGSNSFPLYLYPNGKPHADLFDHENGRRPNLNAKFIADMESKLGKLGLIAEGEGDLKKTFGPEDVFHYIYAVFHAPSYRARYAEFLKVDFPRVPLTSSLKLFRGLCGLGARLVALHLMEADGPRKAMPRFPVDGDNMVERVRYADSRVWINGTQYFEPVPPEVWEFHIGGYRVAEKWLKDRKGRKLGFDELDHYCRTIAALSETMQVMAEIDKLIESQGGWPLK